MVAPNHACKRGRGFFFGFDACVANPERGELENAIARQGKIPFGASRASG
jgi:hypothetical protein